MFTHIFVSILFLSIAQICIQDHVICKYADVSDNKYEYLVKKVSEITSKGDYIHMN